MYQEPGRRAGVTLLMEMEYWTWPPSYDAGLRAAP